MAGVPVLEVEGEALKFVIFAKGEKGVRAKVARQKIAELEELYRRLLKSGVANPLRKCMTLYSYWVPAQFNWGPRKFDWVESPQPKLAEYPLKSHGPSEYEKILSKAMATSVGRQLKDITGVVKSSTQAASKMYACSAPGPSSLSLHDSQDECSHSDSTCIKNFP